MLYYYYKMEDPVCSLMFIHNQIINMKNVTRIDETTVYFVDGRDITFSKAENLAMEIKEFLKKSLNQGS